MRVGVSLVAVIAALVLAACGSENGTGSAGGSGSSCQDLAKQVEGYDILAAGASREGYLAKLHTLQRDCPSQAKATGLTGDFLKPCQTLTQENCTMYRKP